MNVLLRQSIACVVSHMNPLETHELEENDVEIFDSSKLLLAGNSIEQLQQSNEDKEKKKEEELVISAKQDQNPFLSVLRLAV